MYQSPPLGARDALWNDTRRLGVGGGVRLVMLWWGRGSVPHLDNKSTCRASAGDKPLCQSPRTKHGSSMPSSLRV